LPGILGSTGYIADLGVNLSSVARDFEPFARERVADLLNALTKRSSVPKCDDVDGFVADVDLIVLVRDFLIQHIGLALSRPENQPLEPIKVF
jgi:hypothetical protein